MNPPRKRARPPGAKAANPVAPKLSPHEVAELAYRHGLFSYVEDASVCTFLFKTGGWTHAVDIDKKMPR